MTIVIPTQGEEHQLDLILAIGYTLHLYKNDVTNGLTAAQQKALTESSFTEADFAGYSSKSLTGGSWTTTTGNPTTGTYTQQTFTRSSTGTAQLVYGYYVTRTSDGKLEWFEDFAGAYSIELINDAIQITPTYTLDDDPEAVVVAKGIVGTPFTSTSSSAGYTASGATDFAIANFEADSTRNYTIHLHSSWNTSAAGRWRIYAAVDGSDLERIGEANSDGTINDDVISSSILWQPDSGTYDLSITVTEHSGTSTLLFYADATTARQFWVEDAGPRS